MQVDRRLWVQPQQPGHQRRYSAQAKGHRNGQAYLAARLYGEVLGLAFDIYGLALKVAGLGRHAQAELGQRELA